MKRCAVWPLTMRSLPVLALGLALGLAPKAAAQSPEPQATERRVVIDMGEDVIEGRLNVPDGMQVHGRNTNKFRSLIQVRTDFRKEILASSGQL